MERLIVMPRFIPAIAATLLTISLAACTSSATPEDTQPVPTDDAQPTATEETTESAEETPEFKGVIQAGGTGVSYPSSFKEGNDLVGFDTEVITEAARRAGYEVEFTIYDFPGLLGAVSSGRIDTTATNLTWTDERAEVYVFSTPYAYDGVGLAARADNDEINTPEDIAGKVIAAGVGTTNERAVRDWIEQTGNGATIRTFDTAQSTLQEVLVGRADVLARPYGATVAQIELQDLELKLIGEHLIFEQSRFPFADTERGRQLAQEISDALISMHEDGTLTELSEKYYTYDRTAYGDTWEYPDHTSVTLPEDFSGDSQD